MNTHWATQQAAFTSLQHIVNFVMNDNWRWLYRLCFVPILNGAIQPRFQRGIELMVLRRLTQVIAPVLLAKSR